MELDVDHVTLAGTDLDTLRTRLEDAGLVTTYGGEHADGTTHMATVVFRDGSYLETIAPTPETEPGTTGFWPSHLAGNAGPAAWCIRPPAGRDARDAACEAIRSGFDIAGPTAGGRTTPDGRELAWDAVVLQEDGVEPFAATSPGPETEALPFVCDDRTPRDWRVDPANVHEGPIAGVETVLVAVTDVPAWTRRFRRLAGVASPVEQSIPGIDGTVHAFPGTPLALVEPDTDSRLTERLETFGPGPCGYLLRVADVADARESYPLLDTWSWIVGRGAWISGETGTVGVVEA